MTGQYHCQKNKSTTSSFMHKTVHCKLIVNVTIKRRVCVLLVRQRRGEEYRGQDTGTCRAPWLGHGPTQMCLHAPMIFENQSLCKWIKLKLQHVSLSGCLRVEFYWKFIVGSRFSRASRMRGSLHPGKPWEPFALLQHSVSSPVSALSC